MKLKCGKVVHKVIIMYFPFSFLGFNPIWKGGGTSLNANIFAFLGIMLLNHQIIFSVNIQIFILWDIAVALMSAWLHRVVVLLCVCVCARVRQLLCVRTHQHVCIYKSVRSCVFACIYVCMSLWVQSYALGGNREKFYFSPWDAWRHARQTIIILNYKHKIDQWSLPWRHHHLESNAFERIIH